MKKLRLALRNVFRASVFSLALVVVPSLARADTTAAPRQIDEGIRALGKENCVKAYGLLRPLAETDDATAQYYLGSMYDGTAYITNDKEKAEKWYLKAAENGNPDAQEMLGLIYDDEKDKAEEASRWFRKALAKFSEAAGKGNAEAQYKLGEMYWFGSGVAKDPTVAFKWFRKAAKQGDAQAMHGLWNLYRYGEGVPKNQVEADKWLQKEIEQYRKKAEHGDPDGQYRLGWFYAEGLGVPGDAREAIRWYQKAAAQGSYKAADGLEEMYAPRYGKKITPEDETMEMKWSLVHARGGCSSTAFLLYEHAGSRINAERAGGEPSLTVTFSEVRMGPGEEYPIRAALPPYIRAYSFGGENGWQFIAFKSGDDKSFGYIKTSALMLLPRPRASDLDRLVSPELARDVWSAMHAWNVFVGTGVTDPLPNGRVKTITIYSRCRSYPAAETRQPDDEQPCSRQNPGQAAEEIYFDEFRRIVRQRYFYGDMSDHTYSYSKDSSLFPDRDQSGDLITNYKRDKYGNIRSIDGKPEYLMRQENGYVYYFGAPGNDLGEVWQYLDNNGRLIMEVQFGGAIPRNDEATFVDTYARQFYDSPESAVRLVSSKRLADGHLIGMKQGEFDKNGLLVADFDVYMKRTDKRRFMNYVLDSQGNWIEREICNAPQESEHFDRCFRERRRIEYY